MASTTKTPRSIIRAPSVVFGALKGSSLRKLSISRNIQSTSREKSNKEEKERKEMEAEEYAKRFRIPSYSVVLKEEKRRNSFRIPVPQYFRSSKAKSKVYQVDGQEDEIEEVVDEEKMAAKTDTTDTTVHYKWKVKRRGDGSRYIVKRPIRSQILKKREAQVYRERAPISTDDDAMSELKVRKLSGIDNGNVVSAWEISYERREKEDSGEGKGEETIENTTENDGENSSIRAGKSSQRSKKLGYFSGDLPDVSTEIGTAEGFDGDGRVRDDERSALESNTTGRNPRSRLRYDCLIFTYLNKPHCITDKFFIKSHSEHFNYS